MSDAPLLKITNVTKAYPTVVANDAVNLTVKPGEIHAVLGENGAGKSTLMKIIYGSVRPDSGRIDWQGKPVDITSPAQARALGIGMVFQHFSLFETLTAAENISLAVPGSIGDLSDRIRAASAQFGLDVIGGTALFRLVRCERAAALWDALAHKGILVRRFDDNPQWLRFGLPGSAANFSRLNDALMHAQHIL